MPRALSGNSRRVLRQLGLRSKSIDELHERTGIRKTRLAKTLWHLHRLGWIAIGAETRKLVVVRRLRVSAPNKAGASGRARTSKYLGALYAAFGIRLPANRGRARTVRPFAE